jgi:hypothetical protein
MLRKVNRVRSRALKIKRAMRKAPQRNMLVHVTGIVRPLQTGPLEFSQL